MSKNWNKGEEITAEGLNNQGLKVVAQDTPGMTLKVNPGVAIVDGVIVKYAGGNTGTFVAPVTDDRIDIVSIDADGDINITQGVEDASPVAPAYLADETVLCEVYLRAGCTEILNEDDTTEAYLSIDSRPLGAGIALIDKSTADPTPANNEGKGVKLESDGRFHGDFIRGGEMLITGASIKLPFDGSVTPRAISLADDLLSGWPAYASSSYTAAFRNIIGISRDNITRAMMPYPSILGSTSTANALSNSGSGSHTVPAGSDRIIITMANRGSGTINTMTFDGVAMTLLGTIGNARYYYHLMGTSASPTTANIAWTASSSTDTVVATFNLQNAHQSAPTQLFSGSTASTTATTTNDKSLLLSLIQLASGTITSQTSLLSTELHNAAWGNPKVRAYEQIPQVVGGNTVSFSGSSSVIIYEVRSANAADYPEVEIKIFGRQDGFSALTKRAKYYVQDNGTLGTSAGTNSLPVGVTLLPDTLILTPF